MTDKAWTPRQRHILNNSQKKTVKQGVLAIFKTADVETGKFLVKNTSLYIFYPLGNALCKRLFIHIREFLAEPNTLCMFKNFGGGVDRGHINFWRVQAKGIIRGGGDILFIIGDEDIA